MKPGADIEQAMLSALAWHVELGATEAIADAPQDRFTESKPKAVTPAAQPKPEPAQEAAGGTIPGPVALAAGAKTLADLAAAMKGWDGSSLKEGARNFVFSDGIPGAPLMVIGEAPGAEEDRQGKPFVGRAGQLLDRMLAAIGLSRQSQDKAKAVYITNMLPWRPPGNRTPSEQEAQAFLPFVERHIELAAPKVILTMGNTPTKAILSTQTGIKRMRGTWTTHKGTGLPLLPSFHPAYLLRQPGDKRLAWFDLIEIAKVLERA